MDREPVAPSTLTAVASACAAPQVPWSPAGPNVSSSRVVIVDDNDNNVVLLQRLIRAAGYHQPEGWTTPREALAHCVAAPPDLLLLDLRMPDLDGLAFLKALRRQLPADVYLPVLVLTADTAPASKQAALAAGATDFLAKPFDRTEVALRVRNLLQTRALYAKVQRDNHHLQAELDEQHARERQQETERLQRVNQLEHVLHQRTFSTVLQPIKDLRTLHTVGVEALTRFHTEPVRPPDIWFHEAAQLGMGPRLELAAFDSALATLRDLPGHCFLSVNASPATVRSAHLRDIAEPAAPRLVVELTEHTIIEDYNTLNRALDELRHRGVRLAIDDAGAGYASLQHILKLRPDIIKLDRALVSAIHLDPARRALASALVTFGHDIGATIIAEGIETPHELATLQHLTVPWGQGYHLGRPTPAPSAHRRLR